MSQSTVPVDLRNPGHVFACLGLMEIALVLLGPPVQGAYLYADDATDAEFLIIAPGESDPITAVLKFLFAADLYAVTPSDGCTDNSAETRILDEPVSLCCNPKGDTLALRIAQGEATFTVTSWADRDLGRDNVKFWGGAAGFSGAGRFIAQREAARLATTPTDATRDPFAVSSTSKSAFSLDARVGGSALDAGFSADQHASIRSVRFPLVEMLAVVGLENARPLRVSRTAYRYGISNLALPCALARAVLGGAAPGFAVRRFAFTLTEPNDYSRLIRDVYEITGEPP